MAKKSKSKYALINVIVHMPTEVWMLIISFLLIGVGYFVSDNKEYPDQHWKSFLNPLLIKLNTYGDFLFVIGILLLTFSLVLLIYQSIQKYKHQI